MTYYINNLIATLLFYCLYIKNVLSFHDLIDTRQSSVLPFLSCISKVQLVIYVHESIDCLKIIGQLRGVIKVMSIHV